MICCPHCEHEHDPGAYPDHREAGDDLECESCGETFWLAAVDWEPVFYTTKVQPQ